MAIGYKITIFSFVTFSTIENLIAKNKKVDKETRNILEQSLAQLPEKYRIVFIMREIEDMSIDETYECLHISKSIINMRLEKAKELLRIFVTELYKTEELYSFHLARCDTIVKNVLNHIEKY